MSAITRTSFLKGQVLEMDRLLELSGDDPLMGSGLRSRKAEIEEELQQLPPQEARVRVSLYFSGEPVSGSYGIDAEFAAKALAPFLDMVKTQYIAEKHGRVAPRGPVRDQAEARLLLTGLPRGSVGFELSPPPAADLFNERQIANVLDRLSTTLSAAGDNDEGFAQALETMSPRAFQRMRDFLKVVADNHASLRLIVADRVCDLDKDRVVRASTRASATTTDEQDVDRSGIFRGAALESGRFDFRADEGEILSGWIADDVSDEQANEMNQLTNLPSRATLHQTTFTTSSGQSRRRWELRALAAVPVR